MKSKSNSSAVNKNYLEDFNLSTKLLSWILKFIGAWPNPEDANLWIKLLYLAVMMITWLIIGATLIPCVLYEVIEVTEPYEKIRSFAPTSFLIICALKYYFLLMNKDLIRRCNEHVKEDWRRVNISEDRQTMLEKTYFARKIVNTCAAFMYGSITFFNCVMPIANGKEFSEDGNFTYRQLPFGFAKLIVDPRPSPYNEIIIFIQCACGYIMHSITVAACSLAAVFVVHTCGQLEVLVSLLHRIVNENDESSIIDDKIATVVQHHVRALRFIQDIDRLLRYVSLMEIVENTMNMCLLGYYVIIEWNSGQRANSLTYISIITSLLFNLFIFCYIGELLDTQYKRVGEMTYMIDWYRIPGKKGLSLILTMLMTNSSKKMTAGNLFTLTIAHFGDIVRTSVGFLNLLRATTM